MSPSPRNSSLRELLVLGDLCLDVDVYAGGSSSNRRASRISVGEGGSAGNVAFTADGLGIGTGLAAPVSGDDLGRMLVSLLSQRQDGVSLYPIDSARTCAIVSLVNARGARRAYYQKNEGGCTLGNLAETASRYKALHMSGYALELFDLDDLLHLVKGLKTGGVQTSLDLFPRIGSTKARPRLEELLGRIDLLFGNLAEFKTLSGSKTLTGVRGYLAGLGVEAVVKMGAKGAMYSGPAGTLSSPPRRVTPSNLRGAGDVFIATFLSSRLRGHGVQQSLDAANTLAGMHVSGDDSKISPEFLAGEIKRGSA